MRLQLTEHSSVGVCSMRRYEPKRYQRDSVTISLYSLYRILFFGNVFVFVRLIDVIFCINVLVAAFLLNYLFMKNLIETLSLIWSHIKIVPPPPLSLNTAIFLSSCHRRCYERLLQG